MIPVDFLEFVLGRVCVELVREAVGDDDLYDELDDKHEFKVEKPVGPEVTGVLVLPNGVRVEEWRSDALGDLRVLVGADGGMITADSVIVDRYIGKYIDVLVPGWREELIEWYSSIGGSWSVVRYLERGGKFRGEFVNGVRLPWRDPDDQVNEGDDDLYGELDGEDELEGEPSDELILVEVLSFPDGCRLENWEADNGDSDWRLIDSVGNPVDIDDDGIENKIGVFIDVLVPDWRERLIKKFYSVFNHFVDKLGAGISVSDTTSMVRAELKHLEGGGDWKRNYWTMVPLPWRKNRGAVNEGDDDLYGELDSEDELEEDGEYELVGVMWFPDDYRLEDWQNDSDGFWKLVDHYGFVSNDNIEERVSAWIDDLVPDWNDELHSDFVHTLNNLRNDLNSSIDGKRREKYLKSIDTYNEYLRSVEDGVWLKNFVHYVDLPFGSPSDDYDVGQERHAVNEGDDDLYGELDGEDELDDGSEMVLIQSIVLPNGYRVEDWQSDTAGDWRVVNQSGDVVGDDADAERQLAMFMNELLPGWRGILIETIERDLEYYALMSGFVGDPEGLLNSISRGVFPEGLITQVYDELPWE